MTTAAGTRYIFDEVVTTFPLGWLKQNKGVFTPPLPPRLSRAIDNISYGQLEKVYVHFPSAFWHEIPNDAESTCDIRFHDAVNEHQGVRNLRAVTFLSPSYIDHPPSAFWNQACISLAALPPRLKHSTLLFYLYGECGTHLVTQITPFDPSSKEYYDILDKFLYPYYSRIPGYHLDSRSCKPLAFLATQWQNDPWAGNGSYSNFQVGLEEGDRDIEIMREGMGIDRGIWFAGEHTAPFAGLGTTTGAYWSGESAAERICEFWAKQKGESDIGTTGGTGNEIHGEMATQ